MEVTGLVIQQYENMHHSAGYLAHDHTSSPYPLSSYECSPVEQEEEACLYRTVHVLARTRSDK